MIRIRCEECGQIVISPTEWRYTNTCKCPNGTFVNMGGAAGAKNLEKITILQAEHGMQLHEYDEHK